MRKWTRTAGLLFIAAASVYSDQVSGAQTAGSAKSTANKPAATDVKLLEETVDPFAIAPDVMAADSAQGGEGAGAQTVNDAAKTAVPVAPAISNSDGTFSLNIVSGADLVEQLRVIGFQSQMSIVPSKDVRGSLPPMDLYNVTMKEALDALLAPNGLGYREKGNIIYVYTAKELAALEQADRSRVTEVFRLYYTPAANAATMIKPTLSGDAEVSLTTPAGTGIESGSGDVGGDSHATEDVLVVTDYPENLDAVRKLLAEIDRRPQQVLIEATILRAALSEDNALGVDFNVLAGVDFASITAPNGQVNSANPANPITAGNGNVSSVGTGRSFTSTVPNGFKVGFVSDNVSIFLSALEGVTDTTVLANPKVLALNKQKGEIIVGRKDGYITTTSTETTTTQTVEFLDTGTRLIFRPYISGDGFIRMEVHPEDSSGGVNDKGLPSKITTEVTSNIMIRDGHTVVIGGLFRESSESAKSQVPVLGNIPLAGALFRNQRDRTAREEVIILLTPHIIKDDVAYSRLSAEELARAEQLRVGVRKGMMFTGRERLAELNYELALSALHQSKPDRGRALWHLNAATNLNPKYLEAIELKQELTGKVLASSDNSSIRSFITRQVMSEKDLPAPASPPKSVRILPEPQAPTTRPVSDAMIAGADAPSTQPVDQAVAMAEPEPAPEIPASQPVAAIEVAVEPMEAVAPDVQENTVILVESPTTQPESITRQLIAEEIQTVLAVEEPAAGDAPTTEPSSEPMMTVTELPLEDLISVPSDNDNK